MADLADRFVAHHKGARIAGVLLVAVAIFLVLSLATHSNQDPPNASQPPEGISNRAGRIGAYVSYGTLTAVGYAAYVLPLLAFLWGWNRFTRRSVRQDLIRSLGLLGLAVFFSIASALAAYLPHAAQSRGGLLGLITTRSLLEPYAGRTGSAILLGALLLASLILSTEIDVRHGLLVGRGLRRAGQYLHSRLRALWTGLRNLHWPRRRHEPESETSRNSDHEPLETAAQVTSLPTIGSSDAEGDAAPETVPADEGDSTDLPPHSATPLVRATDAPEPPDGGQDIPSSPPRSRRSKNVEPDDDPPPEPTSPSGEADAAVKWGRPASGRYRLPAIHLLDPAPARQGEVEREALLANARVLEDSLGNFDVSGKVVEVSPGPVVTRYEVEPASGVKVNRIVALTDDLARVMSAEGIRIQAPVPGKSVVGIEIANHHRETVYFKEIVESSAYRKSKATLAMALGKTISGETYVADLARMPHLLVAGATGSGKSVCINSLISSILFKAAPDKVRLLMVDPKVVELAVYNDIPHLLVPVVTEPKKASEALKWAVAEMESRYQLLARLGVRNLDDYNRKVEKQAKEKGAEDVVADEYRTLPYVVIIIDEFADLMLMAPADVETSLMSLAQKSRAVGLHIILATQRPSVNVITGVIKANFPSRIAFQVASKTDSRTILDMNGAERLLGRGDMLFLPGGQGEPIRVHGAFISMEETERLVQAVKETQYEAEEVAVFHERTDISSAEADRDALFDDAVEIVVEYEQASTSFLQRRMKVGYSRAARLMDELESAGIVGPAEGAKPREILVDTGRSGAGSVEDAEEDGAPVVEPF